MLETQRGNDSQGTRSSARGFRTGTQNKTPWQKPATVSEPQEGRWRGPWATAGKAGRDYRGERLQVPILKSACCLFRGRGKLDGKT